MATLLKTILFTCVMPGSITVLFPRLILGASMTLFNSQRGPLAYSGLLLLACGAALYCRCALDFVFTGKGTPAPIDPPKTLVVRGPYRFTRNPMYVAVTSVLLGEAIFFESAALLLYAAFVFLCFNLFVFFYEEPTLRRMFGESYRKYCEAVPRWLPRRTAHPL